MHIIGTSICWATPLWITVLGTNTFRYWGADFGPAAAMDVATAGIGGNVQAEVLRAGMGTGIPSAEPFASGLGGTKLVGNGIGGYGSEADGEVADALKPATGV